MTFQVELVSPEGIAYSGEAEMVIARTVGGGDIAFQPGHVPFVGVLAVCRSTWSIPAATATPSPSTRGSCRWSARR